MYSTFQKEHYHTIRCWNLMEFIMTSPELPIRGMDGEKPIYLEDSEYERRRRDIFPKVERGALEFAHDVVKNSDKLRFGNKFVTKWVNDFLMHPSQDDRKAFGDIRFSELADHSDSILLNPFRPHRYIRTTILGYLQRFAQKHFMFINR